VEETFREPRQEAISQLQSGLAFGFWVRRNRFSAASFYAQMGVVAEVDGALLIASFHKKA
jgi:hypothetical protein